MKKVFLFIGLIGMSLVLFACTSNKEEKSRVVEETTQAIAYEDLSFKEQLRVKISDGIYSVNRLEGEEASQESSDKVNRVFKIDFSENLSEIQLADPKNKINITDYIYGKTLIKVDTSLKEYSEYEEGILHDMALEKEKNFKRTDLENREDGLYEYASIFNLNIVPYVVKDVLKDVNTWDYEEAVFLERPVYKITGNYRRENKGGDTLSNKVVIVADKETGLIMSYEELLNEMVVSKNEYVALKINEEMNFISKEEIKAGKEQVKVLTVLSNKENKSL